MAKSITIHAGHNKQGKVACGASDYIDESKEARIITKKVANKLRKNGFTVYNTTVNNGTSQSDVLKKIVTKCNKKFRSLDVSIHFNACTHSKADGKVKGCEVYLYKYGTVSEMIGKEICKRMEKIGFTNRGVKVEPGFYFLRNTTAKSMLIEVCFVDDEDDAKLYLRNKDKIATIITNSIVKYASYL